MYVQHPLHPPRVPICKRNRLWTLFYGSAGDSDTPEQVYAIVISALTFACSIYVAARRGGIILNNYYTAVKVLILVDIIVLGLKRSCGFTFGGRADPTTYPTGNFDINASSDGTP